MICSQFLCSRMQVQVQVQVRVVAGDDAAYPDLVGDDLAVEHVIARELGEPGFGLRAGWAGSAGRSPSAPVLRVPRR
ncbi:hypothetical protein ACIBVL_28870 [Streptomyces sp. NPDC049687]|uniref:hypothetical protein n=1 Tax=Streptomyces sp. NPDC049687 TaxID=3365596 RepID=UPI00378B57F0